MAYKDSTIDYACKGAIKAGYVPKVVNGSIHITMPDKGVLICHPLAINWRVRGDGTIYDCKDIFGAINAYVKTMDKSKVEKSTEPSMDEYQEMYAQMMAKNRKVR